MTNPRKVTKDFITDNLIVAGWIVKVNDSWFELSKTKEYQIYLQTSNTPQGMALTEHKFMEMASQPNGEITTIFVYVSAPTEDGREILVDAMKLLYRTRALTHNPTEGDGDINDMFIRNDFPMDKDCKMDCPTWIQIFEIVLLW